MVNDGLFNLGLDQYRGRKCLNIKMAKVYVPNLHQFLIIGSILCCFTDHPYQGASSIKNWQSSIDFKAVLRVSRFFSLKIGISPISIFLTDIPNLEIFLTYSVFNDRQSNDEFVVCS